MSTIQLVDNLNLLITAIGYWENIWSQAIDFGDDYLYYKASDILAGLRLAQHDYNNELASRES